jgi:hypothetical protein
MLIGFAVLVTSFAVPNENLATAALLLILPSITLNIAMQWIKIGKDKVSIWINVRKDKVSIIAFFVMLSGFMVLVASFAIPNENMGSIALLLILPSLTLNVALRWFHNGSDELIISKK